MNNGETISEHQTRFTHIVNHLLGLGNTFEDCELNIKILNCLTRTWESNITAIKESKDLATMMMETFFGKLLAYEHELIQQYHAKETEKELHSKSTPQRKITTIAPAVRKRQRIST